MGAFSRKLFAGFLFFILVICFQNCGSAFEPPSTKPGGSETSTQSEAIIDPPAGSQNTGSENASGDQSSDTDSADNNTPEDPTGNSDNAGSSWQPGMAYPLDVAQIHSGHSLTDSAMFQGTWPGHGIALINSLAAGTPANVGKSTVPGSPMWWRRERDGGTPDAWNEIRNWQLLVITERNDTHPVALFPSGWQAEERQAKRNELRIWLDHAWQNGNNGSGTPLIYYTNWPAHEDYAPSSSWRQRLADNEVEWMARVSYAEANKLTGAPPVRIIPGNALMMKLYDDAAAGLVPGLRNANDFLSNRSGWWGDSVHAGPFIALALSYLHVAVIHGVDPLDMPHRGLGLSMEPSDALAEYLKSAVRSVVINTPRSSY